MPLTIHVGAHKTGTTVIQRTLRSMDKKLAAQDATFIPYTHKLFRSTGMRGISRRVNTHGAYTRDDMKGMTKLFSSAVQSGRGSTILSYEGFMGPSLPPHHAKRDEPVTLYPATHLMVELLEQAVPETPRVVIYIRGQAGLVESMYAQHVKIGRTLDPFPKWLRQYDLESLSWRPAVERFVAAFGEEQVALKSFQLPRIGPEAHVREFLEDGCGVSADFPVPEVSANRSYSQVAIDIALAANRLISQEDRKTLARLLRANFSTASHPKAELLTPEQRTAIDERYRDENADLLASFGTAAEKGRTVV